MAGLEMSEIIVKDCTKQLKIGLNKTIEWFLNPDSFILIFKSKPTNDLQMF